MAWTDAARAASAMSRKMHAKPQSITSLGKTYGGRGSFGRIQYARALKLVRKNYRVGKRYTKAAHGQQRARADMVIRKLSGLRY